jgi:hypothetical protein
VTTALIGFVLIVQSFCMQHQALWRASSPALDRTCSTSLTAESSMGVMFRRLNAKAPTTLEALALPSCTLSPILHGGLGLSS